ncbi:MAG: NBR1-Ig-like domain-containing protein [Chloroflexota bacterium]
MIARKSIGLSALLFLSLLLGACGPSNESVIATSVALTVQAQKTAQSTSTIASFPTATIPPGVTPIATLTNIVPTAGPSPVGGFSYLDCAKASLVSDTPPDGTLMAPETYFMKTWKIKNDSGCWWTTDYKIIFWDGDVMGGAYIYNLPQGVGPEQTVDITIQLLTPDTDGHYQGYWKLQTPDGYNFGVGQYNQPFYVDVVVDSNIKKDEPKITSVTYTLTREPGAGCATNVFYYFSATITTNGPIDVRIQWLHSDYYTSPKYRVTLKEAGTFETPIYKGFGGWSFHLGNATGEKWVQLWQVEPYKVEFDKLYFSYLCG